MTQSQESNPASPYLTWKTESILKAVLDPALNSEPGTIELMIEELRRRDVMITQDFMQRAQYFIVKRDGNTLLPDRNAAIGAMATKPDAPEGSSGQLPTMPDVPLQLRHMEWMTALFLVSILGLFFPILDLTSSWPQNSSKALANEISFAFLIPGVVIGFFGVLLCGRRVSKAILNTLDGKERLFLMDLTKSHFFPNKEGYAVCDVGVSSCIYCGSDTRLKRASQVRFTSQGTNWGAYLGGIIGGLPGAMIGSAVLPRKIRRMDGVPENVSGVRIRYPVCEGCRPSPGSFSLRGVPQKRRHWLSLVSWMGAGWFVVCLFGLALLSKIGIRLPPEPGAFVTLVLFLPGALFIGCFAAEVLVSDLMHDAVRLRLDGHNVVIGVPPKAAITTKD